MINLFNKKNQNQLRIIKRLKNIERLQTPNGWQKIVSIAVGGLTEIGFSKTTNHLLIISNTGRSLINCSNGERLARDYEENGDWYNPLALTCQGIGTIAGELIDITGLCGGGLPIINQYGESLELVAINWPLEDIYFCPSGKSVFIENLQTSCQHIFSDYIQSYGFSWNGVFIVIATSSDVTIWQRLSPKL
ncbi:hypothetical protein RHO14_06635 [Orbus wheelerorum]|uniref:hypothetical protein n=1 Tax=Orbus wheelerorum TaxID=3074111 RepID=UPI00370D5047